MGRKPLLIASAILQIFVSVLFYPCWSLYLLVLLRIAMGFCFGLGLPLTTTTMVEHLPVKNRGRWVVMISLFITLGKLLAVALARLCLNDLTTGNWRLMVAVTSVLPAITLVGTIFFVHESPRFCLFNEQASRCYSILKSIKKTNFEYPRFLLHLDNIQSLDQSKPD